MPINEHDIWEKKRQRQTWIFNHPEQVTFQCIYRFCQGHRENVIFFFSWSKWPSSALLQITINLRLYEQKPSALLVFVHLRVRTESCREDPILKLKDRWRLLIRWPGKQVYWWCFPVLKRDQYLPAAMEKGMGKSFSMSTCTLFFVSFVI